MKRYVLIRKADQKYLKGSGMWQSWVDQLEKAKVFTHPGHCVNAVMGSPHVPYPKEQDSREATRLAWKQHKKDVASLRKKQFDAKFEVKSVSLEVTP